MRGVPQAALAGVVLVTGLVAVAARSPATHRGPRTPLQVVEPAAAPPPAASRSRQDAVRPLGHLRQPDVTVTVSGPLTAAQVAAVRRVRGVAALTELARGRRTVAGRAMSVVGLDPSSARAFTPRETALSDALWQVVGRGDAAVSYGTGLALGGTVQVGSLALRLGGLAAFGLPADVVVDREVGASLGLLPDTLVVSAPSRGITGLSRDLHRVLGERADIRVLRPEAIVYRRPSTYLELYQLSARYCPGLSWTVLAAIGQVESGHGRNVGPSSAGALGPMQFLPSTWAWAGVDGDGDGTADIMSPYDAVPAAALYLCRDGAGLGGHWLYSAIYSYNHADWYVREVLALAAEYR